MYDFKNRFSPDFVCIHRAKYIFSRYMFCLPYFWGKIQGVSHTFTNFCEKSYYQGIWIIWHYLQVLISQELYYFNWNIQGIPVLIPWSLFMKKKTFSYKKQRGWSKIYNSCLCITVLVVTGSQITLETFCPSLLYFLPPFLFLKMFFYPMKSKVAILLQN